MMKFRGFNLHKKFHFNSFLQGGCQVGRRKLKCCLETIKDYFALLQFIIKAVKGKGPLYLFIVLIYCAEWTIFSEYLVQCHHDIYLISPSVTSDIGARPLTDPSDFYQIHILLRLCRLFSSLNIHLFRCHSCVTCCRSFDIISTSS